MKHDPDLPPRWRGGLVKLRHVPVDFEAMFVERGRIECQKHYGGGRFVIDHWLRQRGKAALIAKRAAFVSERREEQRRTEKLREMAKIFSRSFPVEDRRIVSDELASVAAQYLRIKRNGGFFISPTGAGDWWVGTRRMSSADLLDLAKSKGFVPSLTGDGGSEVGSVGP